MKPRGGKREGAGRPHGIGKYSCATKPIRVPVDMINQIDNFIKSNICSKASETNIETSNMNLGHEQISNESLIYNHSSLYSLPLYDSLVSAGFPSPAEDHIARKLDLNEYLIPKPNSTFFVRVTGDSMIGAHIYAGDLLIVDRSIEAKHNKIIIAAVGPELTVKRLYKKNGLIKLAAENPNYPDLVIKEEQELIIWGVVTSVIHQY
ncbi:MAG: translesion error-prone DNA polymerase V autoproteolytic subunit [Rickettsiaceae bacterium]|nr:translesion error-prone DNA polymerase V autoproteolytic subunit [Rickettsiaceae bacterium]